MRVSGERIRREQEESRTRSKLGNAGTAQRTPDPFLSFLVDGVYIDWLVVLWGAQVGGVGAWGLAFAATAVALRVLTSRTLTIQSQGDSVRATIKRPWQRGTRAKELVIEGALLHHWRGWFCGGFELSGRNASIVASSRMDRRFRPPLGVHAAAAPRPVIRRLSLRVMALHLPNLLAMVAVVAVTRNAGGHGLLLVVASYCAASSLACCLAGDPQLVVTVRSEAS